MKDLQIQMFIAGLKIMFQATAVTEPEGSFQHNPTLSISVLR